MLYLLTLGWPWFISAAALGVVVGVALKPRGAGLIPNKGFALLGTAIIILLVAAVLADKFEGRTALTLDVALLAGCGYFFGVLGGGAIRTATSAKSTEKPKSRQAAAPITQFNGGGVVRRAETTHPSSARVARRRRRATPPRLWRLRARRHGLASGRRRWPHRAPLVRTILRRSRESGPRARKSLTRWAFTTSIKSPIGVSTTRDGSARRSPAPAESSAASGFSKRGNSSRTSLRALKRDRVQDDRARFARKTDSRRFAARPGGSHPFPVGRDGAVLRSGHAARGGPRAACLFPSRAYARSDRSRRPQGEERRRRRSTSRKRASTASISRASISPMRISTRPAS